TVRAPRHFTALGLRTTAFVAAGDDRSDAVTRPGRAAPRSRRHAFRRRSMISRDFLKAGHTPTLFAAFLYFDLSFMVWVILGPLGVAIAKDFHLDPAQKGLMVAVPVLAGAVLRLVNGVLVDRIGPKNTGMINQLIVLSGLVLAWTVGIHDYHQVLA